MGKTKSNKGIKLIVAVIVLAILVAGMVASIYRYNDKYVKECTATNGLNNEDMLNDPEYWIQYLVENDEMDDAFMNGECELSIITDAQDGSGHACRYIITNYDDSITPIKVNLDEGDVLYVKAAAVSGEHVHDAELHRGFSNVKIKVEGNESEDSTMDINYILTITKTYKEFGIIAIVLLVLILIDLVVIVNLITKTTDSGKSIYDERQLMARGKASSYGFMVATIYSIAVALLSVVGIELPLETSVLILLGVMLSIGVYVCYAILNDAYFALNQKRGGLLVILGIIAVGSLALAINGIIKGTFITDGIVTWNSALLMLFILVVSIFVTLLIKTISDKKEAD